MVCFLHWDDGIADSRPHDSAILRIAEFYAVGGHVCGWLVRRGYVLVQIRLQNPLPPDLAARNGIGRRRAYDQCL